MRTGNPRYDPKGLTDRSGFSSPERAGFPGVLLRAVHRQREVKAEQIAHQHESCPSGQVHLIGHGENDRGSLDRDSTTDGTCPFPGGSASTGCRRANTAALNQVCRDLGTECAMVFTFETERSESTVHVRMFAPLLGVPEGPATGSANIALGAYLVHHASASSALRRAVEVTEPTTHVVSEQGAEINRPSTIYIELALRPVEGVDGSGEEITAVRVGGQVVLVAEGVIRF